MQSAIQLENITFSRNNKIILENISANIPQACLNILLGTNGSGKSTLLQIITHLQTRYQGQVYILGLPQQKLKPRERANKIGFLGQFFHLVFPFKVEDLLLTGRAAFRHIAPNANDYRRMQQVMDEMHIRHLQGALFTELSGGEKQLVLIGRILMQNPDILIFDEPTNHLDIYYQQRVLSLLQTLRSQGYTVLCTLHNPTQAFQFADNLMYMHQGQLRCPSSEELADGSFLEKIYQVPFQKVPLDLEKYTFISRHL